MRHHDEIKSLDLPIGEVRKVGFGQDIPQGWRKMRIDEGRQYKRELQTLLSQWSIVAFQIGAIVGHGYGGKFWEHYGGECGEGFIVGPPILQGKKLQKAPVKQTQSRPRRNMQHRHKIDD